MRIVAVIIAAVLSASCAIQSVPSHEINKKNLNCSALPEFRDADIGYFSGWQDHDFKSAISLAKMCRNILNDRQIDLVIENLKARQNEVIAAKEAERVEATERRLRWQRCTEGRDYQFYVAEQSVIKNWHWIGDLTKRQDQEKEYAKASGVRDLSSERAIGMMLVNARRSLMDSYESYREYGGKKAPHEVRQSVSDPCRNIR